MNRRLLAALFVACLAAPAFPITEGADPVGIALSAVDLPGNAGLDLALRITDDADPVGVVYAVQAQFIEDSPEPFPTIAVSILHEGDAVVVRAHVGEVDSGTLVLAVHFEGAAPVIVAIDVTSIVDDADPV